ncbi:MAG TPA: FxDxF family PEP-CTERM protein [Caulobacteraceae bacterium]|nr:FxDxF family PEP-CTERM protein [Caulobacteraceae bacterium]
MNTALRAFTIAGAAVALAAVAAPASATTFAMLGGPLTPGAELSVPATVATGGVTYDFTFTDSVATNALTQMQEASRSGPIAISYSLFSGAPGSGTLLMSSGAATNAPTFAWNFTPGNYYLEIKAPASGTISGGVSAVPEPSAWAMLIAGFGLAGYALRRRRLSLNLA